MIEVRPRTRTSIVWLAIVIVGAGWAAYGILGLGQTGLAVMLVLSIVLIGGAFALLRTQTADERTRR